MKVLQVIIAIFFLFIISALLPQYSLAQPVLCSSLCPPSGDSSYDVDQCSIIDPSPYTGACVSTGQACGYSGEICYCCQTTNVVNCPSAYTCTNVVASYCQGYLASCQMDSGGVGNCCDLDYNTFQCALGYHGGCLPDLDTESCDESAGYTVDGSLCPEPGCDTTTRHTCKRVETCSEAAGQCRPMRCLAGEGNLGNIPPCQIGDVCCIAAGNIAKVPIYCNSFGESTTNSASGTIFSAIGCIPVTGAVDFLEFLFPWVFGMAGGIALLLIAYAGFLIITSGGNYTKLQSGKELLTAAVGGILLVALSSFIMRVLGVDIFKIFQ
jgi:hypothetical protein